MAVAQRAAAVAEVTEVGAVELADRARAGLNGFRARVNRAFDDIAHAANIGRIGVSFSGGKDSTVLLDVVRRVVPDAPAAFFDSGCELQSTYDIVRQYGATVIPARLTFQEMARYCGWWGYADPVDAAADMNAKAVLIDEPAETFVVRERLMVSAVGLRAAESRGRFLNAATRRELYQGSDRTWMLTPLIWWTTDEIWAYIADRNLAYNAAYDRMAEVGIPRAEQRIGSLLGASASQYGRVAQLKRIDLSTYNRLAAEFPLLRRDA